MGILIFSYYGCVKDNDIPPNNESDCNTSSIFNPTKTYDTMTDQEGNVYKTIQIGSQIWMAENLRTTKYRNGEKIPEVTENSTWNNLNTGAYCNYNNTKSNDTICTFGRLYNWSAVIDDRKIAPSGWHVPTYGEWMILENHLGDSVAGKKLKETGSLHWQYSLNKEGDNETGFTALPGGYRWVSYAGGTGFFHIGIEGGWWTVTEGDPNNLENAHHITMGYNYNFLGGCNCSKRDGYAVRCVKD
ncbi:MAG: hypothetical protein DWQ02_10220 [Bacteroidetes bacterium]|nr:MAG: hypothetical protein DWQ02_10220 [Bacteroidota bacterium]